MTLKETLEEHNRQTELNYFKRKLADILLWQVIQKAVKANVGEVREWSNGKHKKLANGKWIPVRENEKINQMAIELKRKIDLAESEEDLMKIIAGSKQYFTDGLGFFFPIVKELDKYIDRKHAKLEVNSGSGYAVRLRNAFYKNTDKYLWKEITNKKTGIEAVFSPTSQKELGSRTVNTKLNGFTLSEHFEVANQIIELFENADFVVEHEDFKNNRPDLKIERFLSQEVTLKSGKKVQACITIKRSLDKDYRNIYSIEAIDIKEALDKTKNKAKGR